MLVQWPLFSRPGPLSGPGARTIRFLQGLLTNDARRFGEPWVMRNRAWLPSVRGDVDGAREKARGRNGREVFVECVVDERKLFHEAYARRALTADSYEACLHRRIAELKGQECQTAVEDVVYMLILYKFSEIKVHLIPRLSKCIYNGRLEILPAKDWELESIHSFEILEMIREHLTSTVGSELRFCRCSEPAP